MRLLCDVLSLSFLIINDVTLRRVGNYFANALKGKLKTKITSSKPMSDLSECFKSQNFKGLHIPYMHIPVQSLHHHKHCPLQNQTCL